MVSVAGHRLGNRYLRPFSASAEGLFSSSGCSKLVESMFVSTIVFLLNKSRYKNKCGGDLSKSPIANYFVISAPTCCTSSMVQHAEDQDRWNPEEDGQTSGSTKPPLISLSSLFFLFKRWFVQHYPQTPSLLSLNKLHADH